MRLGPNSSRNSGQQAARLGHDAILELRVTHKRGALHRTATLVIVDTGLAGCIGQDFGDNLVSVNTMDATSAIRFRAGRVFPAFAAILIPASVLSKKSARLSMSV
jgi:hypothetical protein